LPLKMSKIAMEFPYFRAMLPLKGSKSKCFPDERIV